MPTSLPIAVVRRRWRNPFLYALIVLYAACGVAMIDAVVHGSPITDLFASLNDPGL